jgi:hypothetical protein
MNKLDQKLIECFELRELKTKYSKSQRWLEAAETREKERIVHRECYNIITGSNDDGYSWDEYYNTIKEYCDERFGDVDYKTMIRVIIREEKLKQLGI